MLNKLASAKEEAIVEIEITEIEIEKSLAEVDTKADSGNEREVARHQSETEILQCEHLKGVA